MKTFIIILIASITGALAAISLTSGELYTPWGIASASPQPAYYFGNAVYLTVSISLATSLLIRLALKHTK